MREALRGDYDFMGQTLSLRPRGDGLELQVTGQPAFALGYDSRGDLYPLHALSAMLTPSVRPTAACCGLSGARRRRHRRAAPGPPLPSSAPRTRLARLGGSYPLLPGRLKVFRRDGQLFVRGGGQPPVPVGDRPDRLEVKAWVW